MNRSLTTFAIWIAAALLSVGSTSRAADWIEVTDDKRKAAILDAVASSAASARSQLSSYRAVVKSVRVTGDSNENEVAFESHFYQCGPLFWREVVADAPEHIRINTRACRIDAATVIQMQGDEVPVWLGSEFLGAGEIEAFTQSRLRPNLSSEVVVSLFGLTYAGQSWLDHVLELRRDLAERPTVLETKSGARLSVEFASGAPGHMKVGLRRLGDLWVVENWESIWPHGTHDHKIVVDVSDETRKASSLDEIVLGATIEETSFERDGRVRYSTRSVIDEFALLDPVKSRASIYKHFSDDFGEKYFAPGREGRSFSVRRDPGASTVQVERVFGETYESLKHEAATGDVGRSRSLNRDIGFALLVIGVLLGVTYMVLRFRLRISNGEVR